MNRIGWWLVDRVSRMLEPDEQNAVRGDFAESGEASGQALRDVLGLVVRRQANLWRGWRPWLTFVGVIVPLGMLLSLISRLTAGASAVYTWMYVNNWDWALLRQAGFWYVLVDSAIPVLMTYLRLVCWSWTAGFVLGSVSRGVAVVNSILFCLALLFGVLVGAPQYFAYCWWYIHRVLGVPQLPDSHAPVSALTFYQVIFPMIVQAVLVAAPSLWGLREGAAVEKLPPLLRKVLWTAAILALSMMVIQVPGLGMFLGPYWRPGTWRGWQIPLSQYFMCWPVGYLVARAIGRRWHARIASTS